MPDPMPPSARTEGIPDVLAALKGLWASRFDGRRTALHEVQLAAGETLFRQGDSPDSMYIITDGHVCVTFEHADGTTQIIDELAPGASVGELGLLTGQPRGATVSAIDSAKLVRIAKADFEQLTATDPDSARELLTAMVPRVRRTHMVRVLRAFFGDLRMSALHALEADLEWQHLRSGSVVFRQGDPGDGLYLVVSGRLRIVAEEPDGSRRVVGEVARGESVGEFAVVTGEPRSATVYAVRDTEVVKLSKPCFEQLVRHDPQVLLHIARSLIDRMRDRRPAIAGHAATVRTFAIVPIGQDTPITHLARRLAQSLAAWGPTLHLSSQGLNRLLSKAGIAETPEDHPASIILSNWLDEQEIAYRYIVYEADMTWSSWTSRCVRHADRVLLVGDAGADPGLSEPETTLQDLQVLARKELVLLHAAGTAHPRGTRQWLAARTVAAHHHVRIDRDQDIQRLARRLSGHAVGLVLGGGGARAVAHIGVLRALEEVGLEIDLVGGTSMGSVFAACHASGMDQPTLMLNAKKFGLRKRMFDYTLPVVSFLAGRKITQILQESFGSTDIEDLWRPFFCVSSNLTQAQPMVHRSGPLWKYLRASVSLPAVLPPVADGPDLLVDGGIMNNLPIDVMYELSEGGPVIAVNVTPEKEMRSVDDYGPALSGWRALLSRIQPRGRPLTAPSLVATVLRSSELNDLYHRTAKERLASLVIRPPIERFSMLSFEPLEEIIEVGYRATQAAVQGWQTESSP